MGACDALPWGAHGLGRLLQSEVGTQGLPGPAQGAEGNVQGGSGSASSENHTVRDTHENGILSKISFHQEETEGPSVESTGN